MRQPAVLWQLRAIQNDLEHPAVLHRLQSIRAEIHRNLVQLGRVTNHRRVAGLETFGETYAGRK